MSKTSVSWQELSNSLSIQKEIVFFKKRLQKMNKKNKLKSLISSLSVFTSVLNVDELCQSRDRIHYDTYYSTIVCDNSANFHICNRRNMFVVKSDKSQINKFLPLEAKDIILQASSQSNGYGVTTPENFTSFLLKMYYFLRNLQSTF